MQIRVLGPTLVGGVWHDAGVGNYEPELAKHLIEIGVAEPYETKVAAPTEFKAVDAKKSTSASQVAPASRKKTAKRSKKAV
tara:strand:+ start:889 stop:1131 length:243 start_codon:yes stop_codon:yes gene_type:complete